MYAKLLKSHITPNPARFYTECSRLGEKIFNFPLSIFHLFITRLSNGEKFLLAFIIATPIIGYLLFRLFFLFLISMMVSGTGSS